MSDRLQAKLGDTIIELLRGDITQQSVDAIVNAANSALAGGGGVDGAIHRAAGPELMQELREKYSAGCPTGEARLTKAYQLDAKYVIHAVGPIYTRELDPAAKLASAHHYSLQLAVEHEVETIAFPAISTGVYGYPLDEASTVAIGAVIDFLKAQQHKLTLVRFVLFTPHAYASFSRELARRGG